MPQHPQTIWQNQQQHFIKSPNISNNQAKATTTLPQIPKQLKK
jgi:hypothetical protein